MKSKNRFLFFLAVIGTCPIASHAATLIDGSGITVTASDTNTNAAYENEFVVDGSGITANYGDTGTEWFTNSTVARADTWIAFDLGAGYVLDSIQVWNANRYIDWGINQLDVYVSTIALPGDPEGAGAANWTQIGTNVNFAQTPTQRAADTGFDFETQTGINLPTTAVRHIRFEVDSAFDGNATGYVGLNEVQFTAVPEPSAVLLGGLGLLGLLRRRR
ncbi:PEP-CTERM sorting domain-containing protein [Haloferula sp. A504]|uniref:PEP-CTERM sorting domain-containing protein n=1 Tax=Haloferula sp. A504 TaxID=3373601 RepID=UPI0031BF9628|nr:PEP-CTERM sorting domain-containing protein [Verrucomicrobiaceae bacterium E54]